MMAILNLLGSDLSGSGDSHEGLMSTVDHGRPAQAVSNWVQCENPSCQKWRKIPWHVDIDMLSEKFVCSDNVWNSASASCDAPEDTWDEENDACVDADGSVKPREVARPEETKGSIVSTDTSSCKLTDFRLKARFDVLRTVKKNKWSAATVVDIDFVGVTKKVKFHFPRTDATQDEWLDAGSNRIAPLHTHTIRPQLRHVKKSDPRSKTECENKVSKGKKKQKKEALGDDASFDSSFAMASSENGNETLDDENEYEEVGVGSVEDYEQIGDADTEQSEDEEMELVDHDDDEEEFSGDNDDEDDGLDDEIKDDSDDSDDEVAEEKTHKGAKSISAATVTDHSSPDGSPKGDRDRSTDKTHGTAESTEFSIDGENSMKIPKKKKLALQSGQGVDPSRIPKKKKADNTTKPILGLGHQKKSKEESLRSASTPNVSFGNNPMRRNVLQPAGSNITEPEKNNGYNRARALELARDWEQWKRKAQQSSSNRPPNNHYLQLRKSSIDRNVELRLNRDSLKEGRVKTSDEPKSSADYSLGDRHRRIDQESRANMSELESPRRYHLHGDELNTAYGGRVMNRTGEPQDYRVREAGFPSPSNGIKPDDFRLTPLKHERRPSDHYPINNRYKDRLFDMETSPREYARRYDERPHNVYRSEEMYPREEGTRHRFHENEYMNHSRSELFHRYDYPRSYESNIESNHRPQDDPSHSTKYRLNDHLQPEKQPLSQRGYEVEKPKKPAKRGYEVVRTPSPKRKGYEIEEKMASPSERAYRFEDKLMEDEDLPRRESHYDDRVELDYRTECRHRTDAGTPNKHDGTPLRDDDSYRSHQRGDGRHRDDYSRHEYDDRRSNYDRRRDDRRYESPRSSRRGDHRGRDEYAHRAQEYARRLGRYYEDGYRR